MYHCSHALISDIRSVMPLLTCSLGNKKPRMDFAPAIVALKGISAANDWWVCACTTRNVASCSLLISVRMVCTTNRETLIHLGSGRE